MNPIANEFNSHGQQNHLPLSISRLLHGNGRRHHRARLLAILSPRLDFHVYHMSVGYHVTVPY